MPVRARASLIALLTCVAVVGAACGGGGSSTGSSSNPSKNTGSDSSATGGADETAVHTYGYGPKPADGVTYQPDVVMVPDGPAAIVSATTDGIVWTLKRSAEGVSDLEVGKILVASGRATGRVVAIRDGGDTRVVTLAPVDLPDVIRDGEIDLKQSLDADSMHYQDVPDQPGALSVPGDEDLAGVKPSASVTPSGAARVITVAAPRLSYCACGPSAGELPPAAASSFEITAGEYKITPAYKPGELSLDIQHDGSLKLGAHFAFAVADLSIDSGVSIKGGVLGGSRLVINGINGLDVDLTAGAAGGADDNDKIRVEVPVEINIPVPPSPATAGLPLQITIEFTFVVETAITGKNSTIVASGKYGLTGPIGVKGGSFLAPKFTVQQSIIDSLQGITLGPSGVVLAVKMKVQAGIGIPEASAGPFGSVTTSLGVTNGSSLGASLVRCKGATLDMEVGGGVSVDISPTLLEALKAILPKGTELPDEASLSTNVLHREQVVPDVPLCSGAGSVGGGGGGAAAG